MHDGGQNRAPLPAGGTWSASRRTRSLWKAKKAWKVPSGAIRLQIPVVLDRDQVEITQYIEGDHISFRARTDRPVDLDGGLRAYMQARNGQTTIAVWSTNGVRARKVGVEGLPCNCGRCPPATSGSICANQRFRITVVAATNHDA